MVKPKTSWVQNPTKYTTLTAYSSSSVTYSSSTTAYSNVNGQQNENNKPKTSWTAA
jgi:hypothetical protein